MDYGERKCIVCGKVFIAYKPSSVTCSADCWLQRRRQVHKESYYKRKSYVSKIIEERDALLIENLDLKRRLGIISDKEAEEQKNAALKKNAGREEAAPAPLAQEHVCLACGKSYKPTGTRQRFCSKECREKFKKEQE